MSIDDGWYLPGGVTLLTRPRESDAIDIDAADFDEWVAYLRAHEPPEDAPDAVTIEVSDGVRSETVRARMAPGPWVTWEGKVT